MGSIQPEQMLTQAPSVQDLPASKLPLFHITGPGLDSSQSKVHPFTIRDVSIPTYPEESRNFGLLSRFASFVGDVIGSDHVAFHVHAPETGSALAVAALPGSGMALEPHPKLDLVTTSPDVEDVDFEILIAFHNGAQTTTTNGDVTTVQKRPFVLSVDYTQHDTADITLTLRGDYGGSMAAKHLGELAVAYLTSGLMDRIDVGKGAGAGLEPSRMNFEPFLEGTPETYYSKSTTNGHNKTNGHSIHSPRLLHTAFEDNVRRHPDNVAIDYLYRPATTSTRTGKATNSRRDLTYAELDTCAAQLASEFGLMLQVLESKWRPVLGDQYAFPLFISPSPEFFLAQLAVLKSGHAFCSLPADAPPERLRAIIEDLGAPIVLGVGAAAWNSTAELEDIIWVDITNPSSWRTDRIIPDSVASPTIGVRISTEEDLCYLFYTSGSTGKPKGVLGSHRAGVACVESTLAAPLAHLPTGPRVRWLSLSAPSFDPVIIDTFVPLSLGGVICVAERDLLLTDVEACARELRATASYAVASLALLMRPEHMPELQTLIVGGESVNGRVVEKFARVEGSLEDERRLINAYGPTETTVFCTAEACTQTTRSSVIGDALAAFFIMADPEALDRGELREMPLGLAGELIVGGPQVAHGYLNRPEVTARSFIPVDTFPELGQRSGLMLYRTGDKTRVVWSADGKRKVDFLGRFGTDQVKLNGRRVELTEIENVLTTAQGVASVAVVVVKPKEGGRAELVAFLTVWTDEDRHSVVDKCRDEAKRILPDWMCPGRYIILDHLPWTASGKINRGALVRVATGEALIESTVTNGGLASADTMAENHKDINSSSLDSSSIVNRGLVAALGDHAANSDLTAPLLNLGLDSLRIMLFLQSIRNDGIEDLAMHEVLASKTVQDLISLVESRNPTSTTQDMAVDAHTSNGHANGNGHSFSQKTNKIDDIDVATIPFDDEETLYEMPIPTKLRHFSHHCLAQCTSSLNLTPADIEDVLPATNTQIRIQYLSTLPKFLDPALYSGRPQVEHFLYNIPLDKLDPTRFRHAVDVVLRRHDCFRAVFCGVEHPLAPFAVCILNKDSDRAAIPTVDIVCKFDPENTSLWHYQLISAQHAAEASLSPDRPGVTVTWVRSPDGAHQVMILSLTHPIFDGVMINHLREEIAAEYAHPGTQSGIRSLTGRSTKLQLLPMRATVELSLGSTDWTETMFYWMRRFGGVPDFRIGSTRQNPQASTLHTQVGHDETHMRSSALRSTLSMDELSSNAILRLGTTMAAVVQAAWASVLAQTLKSETVEGALNGNGATPRRQDVQFGTILHGRRTEDLWRCMAPLILTMPMHVVVEMDGQNEKNPTNREVCRILASQHAEAAPYIEIPCPSIEMFELGNNRFDTVLNLQAYQSQTATSAHLDDSTMRDLPGWNPEQNLLTPYKEVDIGFPIMTEVWPAFGPDGPDWSGKMTLKCTYNVRRPGYEFLNAEWVAGMLGAFEDALVRVLREPDSEFFVGS